ncbi:MAG: V-type ATP synthase subunit F [Trueperaceae bacterium]|nr:V-type ATP synthase subunit F [Trueperaceae bacterium]
MRRGRIVVVGPPDTVLGLGLLGIEGTAVTTPAEAAAALDEALAAPGVCMVLLGRAWSEPLRDRVERAALDDRGPLLVEIPDPDDPTAYAPLGERVERVLGLRLER